MSSGGDQLDVAIARIEERQIAMAEKMDRLLSVSDDMESRIVILEQFRWKVAGMAAAVGVTTAVIGRMIGVLIK
jgi:hypothetical protein